MEKDTRQCRKANSLGCEDSLLFTAVYAVVCSNRECTAGYLADAATAIGKKQLLLDLAFMVFDSHARTKALSFFVTCIANHDWFTGDLSATEEVSAVETEGPK